MSDDRFDAQFLWRVEEACGNAYPAWREIQVDGWMARAAGGTTRRINSLNALRPDAADPAAVIETVRPVYARLGQPVMVRAVSLMPEVDPVLDRLGFSASGETLTLMSIPSPSTGDDSVSAVSDPNAGWLQAWARCRPDAAPDTLAAVRQAVGSLMVPAMFFTRHENDAVAAVAYAAVHRGVAVLEAVVTHPAHRQRGHARAIIAAAKAWARHAGVHAFCLQVAADNGPARALYRSLGFDTELYRYHYRTAP